MISKGVYFDLIFNLCLFVLFQKFGSHIKRIRHYNNVITYAINDEVINQKGYNKDHDFDSDLEQYDCID